MGQKWSGPAFGGSGLNEPLERLRAALDASCVVGTWDWDIVRNTMVYDTGAAKLLTGDIGLAHVEITGLRTIAAVHPADHEWLIEHVREAIQVGGLMVAEYRVIDEDGTVRWLLSRGCTYQDRNGRPLRSRGIIIDITETRDGGERFYLLGNATPPQASLDRAAELAIALKAALDDSTPSEVRAAADCLMFLLGRALAQSDRPH